MNQIVRFGIWQGLMGMGLARRELSCLLAVASGHTDKEIAQMDGLSPRSVKGRIESVMNKLGVFKRSALIAEAFRLGLIVPYSALTPNPDHQSQENRADDAIFIA
jgi:DNA-binding CsgD family transcriptional regulator